jgi:hypothetical protein
VYSLFTPSISAAIFDLQEEFAALTLLKLGTPAYNLHHVFPALHLDLLLKALQR